MCSASPGKIGRDTSELQSRVDLVCRLLLEKKKKKENILIQRKKKKKNQNNKTKKMLQLSYADKAHMFFYLKLQSQKHHASILFLLTPSRGQPIRKKMSGTLYN